MLYDDASTRNPKIKLLDIEKCVQGVVVDNDKSDRLVLAPGETKDIMVTTRALLWDSTTQLTFERYVATDSNVRIKWTGTGTAPAFRANRNIGGDATTVVDMTRVSPYTVRITQGAGTAWTLGSVQVGDWIKFEKSTDAFASPFSATNRGVTYQVQAKGTNYIDFVDNGSAALDTGITLGADFAFAVRVFSTGPIKIGDTIEISGSGINPSNCGRFEIVDVSPEYIEVVNPFSQAETVLYGSNSLTVYEYLIGFVHLRASGAIRIKSGDQVEWARLERLGGEALFFGSLNTFRLQANNDGLEDVTISIQYARVTG
jgi:hypothetical protein